MQIKAEYMDDIKYFKFASVNLRYICFHLLYLKKLYK